MADIATVGRRRGDDRLGSLGIDSVREFGSGGVYLNVTGLADEAPSAGVDTAFGRNLDRLAKVKAEYDPDNRFRINNNIQPA